MLTRVFKLKENGTTVSREVGAGLTTFLTMSYIIFVQPAMLADAGMDKGAVLVATCISSAFATLLMGLWARYPIALAPAMGHNAFFAYVVCAPAVAGGLGFTWQQALAAVLISGVAFVLLSFVGLRETLIKAVPASLKYGIAAGIGLLIAVIGLEYGGIVRMAPPTLVTLGDLSSAPALLTFLGLTVISVLLVLRIPGAILAGIIVTAIAALATGVIEFHGFVSAPPSVSPTAFKLDFSGLFAHGGMLSVIFVFFFLDLFDTVGTLIGVAGQAGFLKKDGSLPRARQALLSDAGGTVVGAVLGTSTVTSYIESSAGIAAGGKTGLANIVTALLFLLALFFAPLMQTVASAVPGVYTCYFGPDFPAVTHTMFHYPVLAPALIIVGAFMMAGIRKIAWDDISEAVPAYLAMILMPLTFSITEGIAFGFIAYSILKLVKGEGGRVHWLVHTSAALFILRYIFLM